MFLTSAATIEDFDSFLWTIESAPVGSDVEFEVPTGMNTNVTGLTGVGEYIIRLTGTLIGGGEVYDEITVTKTS